MVISKGWTMKLSKIWVQMISFSKYHVIFFLYYLWLTGTCSIDITNIHNSVTSLPLLLFLSFSPLSVWWSVLVFYLSPASIFFFSVPQTYISGQRHSTTETVRLAWAYDWISPFGIVPPLMKASLLIVTSLLKKQHTSSDWWYDHSKLQTFVYW